MKLAARALSFLYTCARSLSVALYICRSPFAVVVAIACECLCGPRGEPYEEPNLSYEPSAPRPRNWTGAALGYSCQHRKQIPIALWAGIPKKVDLKAERASEADKRVTRNTPPAARSLALWLSLSLFRKLPIFPIRQKKKSRSLSLLDHRHPIHDHHFIFSSTLVDVQSTRCKTSFRDSPHLRPAPHSPPWTWTNRSASPLPHLLAHARTTLSVPASASIRIAFV